MLIARRQLLQHGLATGACLLVRPSWAAPPIALQAALNAFAGSTPIMRGRVQLEVAELIDNGNTVPVRLSADSPMSETDHVSELALFSEKNPQSDTFVARLSPLSGRASVSTRIRLANSQTLVALARMSDGSCWMHSAEVIVTIAACIEDDAL